MLINEEFRRLVGYLAYDLVEDGKRYRVPGATLFFLRLYETDKSSTVYAVTARHCISSNYRRFYIQSNETPAEIETSYDDWVLHPETDIAVCRIADEIQPTCLKMHAQGGLNSGLIRAGHEVFLVGLFDPLPGGGRIEPIVRFGHVSLPETKAQVILDITKKDDLTMINAHLIETRSWGGESGSPVFVYSQHFRTPLKGMYSESVYDMGGQAVKSEISALEVDCRFLGLLHGHFEVERPQQHKRYNEGGQIVDVNAGIAIVVPGREVWKLLMKHERLLRDRERPKTKPTVPVPDSRVLRDEFTKADFEAALRKVSKKVEPER